MEVLHGIDALLYFKNGEGDWLLYGCCETFEVSISTETKSVKTIGDGTNKRSRRQVIGYSVSASGIIRYDDPTGTFNNFDLLEYQMQGVDIEWKAAYPENDGTEFTYLYGTLLITNTTITAPNDFVNGSFEAEGQGELLRGIPPSCSAEINDYTVTQDDFSYALYSVAILTLVSGTVPQYHYRIDGGPIDTALSTGWSFNVAGLPGAGLGDHVLEIWPVCDNGIEGVKTTHNFTTSLL